MVWLPVAIWTYPRSLRIWVINDGGVIKNPFKAMFLAIKNESNQRFVDAKNGPKAELRTAKYSLNLGLSAYLWAYWQRAQSDALE